MTTKPDHEMTTKEWGQRLYWKALGDKHPQDSWIALVPRIRASVGGPKIFPRDVPQGAYYEVWDEAGHTWEHTDSVSDDIKDWSEHVGPFLWRDPVPAPPNAHLAALAAYRENA